MRKCYCLNIVLILVNLSISEYFFVLALIWFFLKTNRVETNWKHSAHFIIFPFYVKDLKSIKSIKWFSLNIKLLVKERPSLYDYVLIAPLSLHLHKLSPKKSHRNTCVTIGVASRHICDIFLDWWMTVWSRYQ